LKPLVLLILVALTLGAVEAIAHALEPQPTPPASSHAQPPAAQDATDVLGANAACLVCHLTFVKEDVVRTHQKEGIGCIKCHGPSVAHANDEHIGATKPDITYPRAKVDAACAKCHKEHDVSPRDVIARFLERKLPRKPAPICTDCHGTHRIARADDSATDPATPQEKRDEPPKPNPKQK
jgi:Cytochrome c552